VSLLTLTVTGQWGTRVDRAFTRGGLVWHRGDRLVAGASGHHIGVGGVEEGLIAGSRAGEIMSMQDGMNACGMR